ncbi:T9SS type A sorting domain-containing protein [Sanyastnella coralliicola]|uniref:T9SS type A sorting domain-containing protein n=1 Tax=Sanyastnella coralliicola TaxID=3069118 RepID=UPI0027B8CF4D|nr:T9SS type A sorting domain-containing protein [Longitalea sp. SCSIO 12813]
MKLFYTLLFAVLVVFAQAQCPDCMPDEMCVSEDAFPTICPLVLPDATAGSYYETVLTFYLPSEIVDPDTQLEAELNQVTITSVTGTPFGIEWQANSPDNTYFPSQGENYGCATICGTPLVPGEYLVNISVTVVVTAFGFEQEVQEGFALPLNVLPGEGGNTSFTYNDLFGCGSLDVAFEALIDGAPGVTTYDWDFGNGNIGNVATPPVQSYNDAGEYTVTLETTIEDYTLNSVVLSQLSSGWGGDVEELSEALFNPDPYFIIYDGNNAPVYTSSAIEDQGTGTWSNIGLILNNPPYSIAWFDQDSGGLFGSDDDALGSASFEIQTGDQAFNGGGNEGSINVSLEVTTVFSNEETVTVFPIPDPTFSILEDPATLDYDNEEFATFVWTLFGDTVQTGAQDSLVLSSPGIYQCEVTNIYGCSAWSEEYVQCPEISIVFDNGDSTLTVAGGFDSYTWFFNGLEVTGQEGPVLENAVPGNYGVTITTSYGCEVSAEVFTVPVSVIDLDMAKIKVWPNPAQDVLNLEVPAGIWDVQVFDNQGRVVRNAQINSTGLSVFNVSDLSDGHYLVRLAQDHSVLTARVLIQR